MHKTTFHRPADLVGRGVVGEIQRHQRLEIHTRGQARKYALTILGGGRDSRDRRAQIGHDDGARELARAVGQNGSECIAIAQMQVPVVGAGEGEGDWGGDSHRETLWLYTPILDDSAAGIVPSMLQGQRQIVHRVLPRSGDRVRQLCRLLYRQPFTEQ